MPYTILIVSDDPRRIAPLLAALAQHGVRAECVPDGAHGLETARKDPPDLIICDLREPPMLDHQFVEATAQDATLCGWTRAPGEVFCSTCGRHQPTSALRQRARLCTDHEARMVQVVLGTPLGVEDERRRACLGLPGIA